MLPRRTPGSGLPSGHERSYPDLIPLDEDTVADLARRIEPFAFDRVYGGWWGHVVVRDGAAAVRRSADRHLARLHGERP